MSAIWKSPEFDELDKSRLTIYVWTRARVLVLHYDAFESTTYRVKITFFQTFFRSDLTRVLPAGLLFSWSVLFVFLIVGS